jgi:hypothetical protein
MQGSEQGFTEQGGKQVRGNVWPNFRVWLQSGFREG